MWPRHVVEDERSSLEYAAGEVGVVRLLAEVIDPSKPEITGVVGESAEWRSHSRKSRSLLVGEIEVKISQIFI